MVAGYLEGLVRYMQKKLEEKGHLWNNPNIKYTSQEIKCISVSKSEYS